MIKYNSKHILVGEIKQLLHSSNIPQYKIFVEGEDNRLFKNHNYIYKSEILKYVGEDKVSSTLDKSEFVFIESYYENKFILNSTRNLELRNNIYDDETHEYLGNYLRFQRDYNNVDLMSMYNCALNSFANNLEIVGSGITYDFNNPSYKVIVVPVKFNKKYTIAIDCSAPIEIIAGFYRENNQITKIIKDASNIIDLLYDSTYQKVGGSIFSQPFVYDKLVNAVNEVEFYNNEDVLKLFIKVPSKNTSSVVVLEGEYSNKKCYVPLDITDDPSTMVKYDYMSSTPKITTSIYGDYQYDYDLGLKQLLFINNQNNYPFADRLIEYLLKNVITPMDEMNIVKLETALIRNKLIKNYTPYLEFTDDLRKTIYEEALNQEILRNTFDIKGFVDKTIEDKIVIDYVYDEDGKIYG